MYTYKTLEEPEILNFTFPVFFNACIRKTTVIMQICKIETAIPEKSKLLDCSCKYFVYSAVLLLVAKTLHLSHIFPLPNSIANNPRNHTANFSWNFILPYSNSSECFSTTWTFSLVQVRVGPTAVETVLRVPYNPDSDRTLLASQLKTLQDKNSVPSVLAKQKTDKIWFPFPSHTFSSLTIQVKLLLHLRHIVWTIIN